jgi:predicted nicotinamide N-methyase
MPGYLTKQETIAVAGVPTLQIRSLLDRQQYSDPDGAAKRAGISSAMWPLFGLLWPSGAHLAARLAARLLQPSAAPGQRILEVGCGLALASLVGHRLGARVTASDCHPLTQAFLTENLRLNGLPRLPYVRGDWAALPGAAPTPQPGYGLIIGSDVLYDRDASVALAGHIGRQASELSEVWIVDPNRGNRAGFARRMHHAGYTLTDERLDHAAHTGVAAYSGHMLTFRR